MLTICTQTSSESQCSTASIIAIPPYPASSSSPSISTNLVDRSSPAPSFLSRHHELDDLARRNVNTESGPSGIDTPRRRGANETTRGPSSATGQAGPHRLGEGQVAVASPRSSKTAKNTAAQNQWLRDYATELFNELSTAVFEERIGSETPLLWNNRLTRTAGRAHYSRLDLLAQSASEYPCVAFQTFRWKLRV